MLPKPLTKASSIPLGFPSPSSPPVPSPTSQLPNPALLDPRGFREGSSTLPHRSLIPDPHPQRDGTGMKLEAGSSVSTQRMRRAQHRRHRSSIPRHPKVVTVQFNLRCARRRKESC